MAELQNLKSPDEIFSEKLKQSKSIIAVLGSNVPSHSNYDRKAKARFLSKAVIQRNLLIHIRIQLVLLRY